MKVSRLPLYFTKLWWMVRVRLLLSKERVAVGPTVSFHGVPIISRRPGSSIAIAEGVTLCSVSTFTALGVARPVIPRTLREGANIQIGRDSGLSGTTLCTSISISVGERCLIGADVMITDTDFHPIAPAGRRHASESEARAKPVVIEDDVFVGARSIVLPGVRIGKGSVIGAGSVVTRNVPPLSVCAGNPARVIRSLEWAGD